MNQKHAHTILQQIIQREYIHGALSTLLNALELSIRPYKPPRYAYFWSSIASSRKYQSCTIYRRMVYKTNNIPSPKYHDMPAPSSVPPRPRQIPDPKYTSTPNLNLAPAANQPKPSGACQPAY